MPELSDFVTAKSVCSLELALAAHTNRAILVSADRFTRKFGTSFLHYRTGKNSLSRVAASLELFENRGQF